MGAVYLAEDIELDRKVALKFLPTHYTADPEINTRLKREAKAAAALNHPNIITVYEISEHEGKAFIAMEHVEGQSLKKPEQIWLNIILYQLVKHYAMFQTKNNIDSWFLLKHCAKGE